MAEVLTFFAIDDDLSVPVRVEIDGRDRDRRCARFRGLRAAVWSARADLYRDRERLDMHRAAPGSEAELTEAAFVIGARERLAVDAELDLGTSSLDLEVDPRVTFPKLGR